MQPVTKPSPTAPDTMHLLYVAQHFDYGDPSRGPSFEHYNFDLALQAMGFSMTRFDVPTVVAQHGRAEAGRRLLEIVRREKPDVLFGVVRGDAMSPRVFREISEQTDTLTINWFCDDHWQFDSDALKWAPAFNRVVTTSRNALRRYSEHNLRHVIKSQWGANHALYRPTPGPMRYDVSFVGQPYGMRQTAVDTLRRAGIKVHAWGSGWPAGKLEQAEMIRVFSQSRINLNFADASSSGSTWAQRFASSHAIDGLKDKPGLWRVWDRTQRFARWHQARAEGKNPAPPRQIKGRVFEVPACGGFLLTQPAEDLDQYLTPGMDCATFETVDDLVEQTRHYLAREDERRAIARHGYERTLAEHTYAGRFRAIFEEAGVAASHASSPTATPRLAA
ncbi:MAG: CgeB family protein [Phycisphaeraceae bacterium]